MASFLESLNPNGQFIIAVLVFPPVTEEPILNPPPRRGLIDTGASRTCIIPELAHELSLHSDEVASIQTAGGTVKVPCYTIDLAIPVSEVGEFIMDGKREQLITAQHIWHHTRLAVTSVNSEGIDFGYDVLIGMDILSKMHITMHGGLIVLSF